MKWKLGLILCGMICLVIVHQFGGLWWAYAVAALPVLAGLIWIGAYDADADRTGHQNWGGDAGRGTGE